jgi:hypothetical protein
MWPMLHISMEENVETFLYAILEELGSRTEVLQPPE